MLLLEVAAPYTRPLLGVGKATFVEIHLSSFAAEASRRAVVTAPIQTELMRTKRRHSSQCWVPHISLVFREMWDTTALHPKPVQCYERDRQRIGEPAHEETYSAFSAFYFFRAAYRRLQAKALTEYQPSKRQDAQIINPKF
jgi:hypothetical protein